MKTLVGLLTFVLALGLVAGPAIAATTHHMTADIRAVNADARTFTVEQHRTLLPNKEYSFTVNDRALLANLNTGERVKITYEKQGQVLVARDVQPVATTTSRMK
jgi:Cu/Ag efflux protein CusF